MNNDPYEMYYNQQFTYEDNDISSANTLISPYWSL